MKKEKNIKTKSRASVENQDIKKVNLHINAFGEIVRDVKTEDINAFLDENVPDKKFSDEASVN